MPRGGPASSPGSLRLAAEVARPVARLALLSLALATAVAASAQVPDALLGTWDSADGLESVAEGDAGSLEVLYTATTFTDSEVIWTTVSRWEDAWMGWREAMAVRAKGDRMVLADTLDTRYRLAGDTLTIDYEQLDGTVVTTVLQRSDSPTVPSGLVGAWSAGYVNDGAGIMVEVGIRFLPDGTVQTVPGSARPQRYAQTGPYLLMWEKLSPERSAQGEVPHYDAYRLALDGDRLTLTRPSETLHLERYPQN